MKIKYQGLQIKKERFLEVNSIDPSFDTPAKRVALILGGLTFEGLQLHAS